MTELKSIIDQIRVLRAALKRRPQSAMLLYFVEMALMEAETELCRQLYDGR